MQDHLLRFSSPRSTSWRVDLSIFSPGDPRKGINTEVSATAKKRVFVFPQAKYKIAVNILHKNV